MGTPHIEAKAGDFAKTVLMPGDPKRAQWIAETFLTDYKLVTSVRGILGYTGYTKEGKKISVMASGMGIPSITIYAHELYTFYGVENIIRVGTCATMSSDIKVLDVLIAMGASSDSNYAAQFNLPGSISAIASYELVEKAVNTAREMKRPFKVGNILSSDIFYDESNILERFTKLGILGVEMESYGLYLEAMRLGKKALCMCTVSDHFIDKSTNLTSYERQTGLSNMIEIALKLAD